ncbi:hypothetical protein [Paraflavitalea sp. CAU 1676]|uniref:hypothetical protein n=1 Tax=Paraflavitalea sp. CAU 1676 TaxID=3032598 RepID=UPI0023DB26A1|nr:hypothetical protein [Paraflavitalea sp. CAU 1676]MDF2192518.1 hypothetical protein [Paraflavitalea sp. CAU 1676]
MATTMHPSVQPAYTIANNNTGAWTRFMEWAKGQDDNRLMWLAIALGGFGCVLTPITILFVSMAGMNLFLFMTALMAMAISLIVNLAAMPTKYTIPVFFLSVLIDVAVIVAALASL